MLHKLPIDIIENIIYIYSLGIYRDENRSCAKILDENLIGDTDSRRYIKTIHSLLALKYSIETLKKAHNGIGELFEQELFCRKLFEQIFPYVTIASTVDERGVNLLLEKTGRKEIAPKDCKRWSEASRNQVLKYSNKKWIYILQYLLALVEKSASALGCSCFRVHSVPTPASRKACLLGQNSTKKTTYIPDETALWIDQNMASCMKMLSPTRFMIFSSTTCYIVLHMDFKRRNDDIFNNFDEFSFYSAEKDYLNCKLGIEECRTENCDDKSLDSPIWLPPPRPFVFEDIVTISSQMDSLHYIESNGDSISNAESILKFERCRMCFGKFPICGQMSDKTCGCCLSMIRMVGTHH